LLALDSFTFSFPTYLPTLDNTKVTKKCLLWEPPNCPMNLGSRELVKAFFETESRRKQIFIRTPLKGDIMEDSCAKEHST
jgi:hypothetical protein